MLSARPLFNTSSREEPCSISSPRTIASSSSLTEKCGIAGRQSPAALRSPILLGALIRLRGRQRPALDLHGRVVCEPIGGGFPAEARLMWTGEMYAMVEAIIYIIFCVFTGPLGSQRRLGFFA